MSASNQPLSEKAAADLRARAEQERDESPELAAVLEDIAANGLPDPDEGTPWEEIRDRRYAEMGIAVDSWHVA
ncbi:hypothetical protein ABZ746_37535 [Streptomyces sp. NPDC020096]